MQGLGCSVLHQTVSVTTIRIREGAGWRIICIPFVYILLEWLHLALYRPVSVCQDFCVLGHNANIKTWHDQSLGLGTSTTQQDVHSSFLNVL